MRNRILGLSCCTVLLLAACDSTIDDNVLNIGLVLSLSGTVEDIGNEVMKGVELARDEINDSRRLGDTKLAFITEDDKSTTDGSVAAVNKLVNEDRVSVIVGPLTSISTSLVLSTVDDAGVVAVGPTSASSGLGAKSKWLFRSSLTVDQVVPTGIKVSKDHLNYRRVATIVNDVDTFSVSSHKKITEVLSADPDITIVSAQSYSRPPGTMIGDLTTHLTEILNTNPDAIFLSGLPEDRFGVITQGHILGITDTPYVSAFFAISDVKRINASIEGAAENLVSFQLWLASSSIPLSKTFVSSFTARHGATPDDFAARGYAAMFILGEALANAENFQAGSIQSALAATKDLPTIYGPFTFDEYGDAIYDPVVAKVKNNEFTILN